MNEQLFYQAVNDTSKQLGINPLLLLSGIEGLYTFKDIELNAINYEFLDSLILTIFALRIGDSFHNLAEENLNDENEQVRVAAGVELQEMSPADIQHSGNDYIRSFASLLNGKSIIRKYHEKALEVAAIEIKKAQILFDNNSIGAIMLYITKHNADSALNLGKLFNQ